MVPVMLPAVVPVVIASVNENSTTQDAVILNISVQNAVGSAQKKGETTEFSGGYDIL